MNFGIRESFGYFQCGRCSCLQIEHVPADLARYYPSGYYSFALGQDSLLRRRLKRLRDRQALGQHSLVGPLLIRAWGVPGFAQWIRTAGVGWRDRILDVGCGGGRLVVDMSNAGFSSVMGIDPHIDCDREPAPGVRILKRQLNELEGSFDFIMLNHSFEHMETPEDALRQLARLLKPGCMLLIRIPVVGKQVWREYGVDWVQLDAPRHLYLHSEESVALLAERTGFRVRHTVYDSNAFQFWGSEQYRRDVPLNDPRSYAVNRRNSFFSPADIKAYEHQASALNAENDGDQACFYLQRT